MMYFRYRKKSQSDKSNRNSIVNYRRKLKNDHLELMLKSSETLLEDFIELEVQVQKKNTFILNGNSSFQIKYCFLNQSLLVG
jgi:hypothetical protein